MKRSRSRLQRLLSAALALCLPVSALPARAGTTPAVVTLESLQAAFPEARLQQVSAEDYARLTGRPMQVVQLIVTPESVSPRISSGSLPPTATPPGPADTNELAGATNAVTGSSVRGSASHAKAKSSNVSTGGNLYISDSGSIDSTEAAVVIFVLAGVVVIAAAVIYSGALLANWALRGDDAPPGWGELSARSMFFSGESQHGYMAGGALTLGLQGDGGDVGAVIEGGYLDADIITIGDQEVNVADGYLMAGLTVRWRLTDDDHPGVFEAELLAGSAARYDLISRASFAFTWSLLGPWRMGLRLGALYLDVADDEGPLYEAGEDFNLLGGLETAIRF